MSNEKKTEVLEAALKAFIRYGFRRVTMGHIAEEAGMSRPALYLVFPNKEAIFRAVVVEFTDRAREEVTTRLGGHGSVADKLRFLFDLWTVRPFEMVHDSPDARELIDCSYDFASDVVQDSQRFFNATLTDILQPGADVLAKQGLSPHQVANVISVAARGFKDNARDVEELKTLIAGIIRMTEAVLDL